MRLKRFWGFLVTLCLGFVLVGCGEPSATQMIHQLQTVQSSLTSYETKAMMTVHVQGALQKYYVETKFRAPNLYSIALGNENKEISQIILHNEQGIYIISPGAKKVIRFEGDWAEKQGYLYLYHSLLNRIIASSNPDYSIRDKVASFVLAADPLNPLISTQKISLDASTFSPKQVVLYDRQKQPVITLDYLSFEKGMNFQPGTFSPDQATTLQTIEMPVSSVEQGFGVIEPSWVPSDDALLDETERNGVVFVRYNGQEPFTMIEERPGAGDVAIGQGNLVTLYGIPAVLTGSSGVHQLYWMDHGVEFQLTSKMATQDLIHVAASTVEITGK